MSAEAWWRLYDEAGVDNLDARSVPCPTCGAAVGVYCRRPSGHKAMSGAHAQRWDDAVRALAPAAPLDVEYADEDDTGQLTVGVPGEQRHLPGLAPRREDD